jgi:hypothetical protein
MSPFRFGSDIDVAIKNVLLGYFHFLAIHEQSMAVGFNM